MEKESICVRNGPFFSSIGASVSLQTGFGQMRRMRSILYSVHIYVQVVKLICYACTLCQPSLRRAQWVITGRLKGSGLYDISDVLQIEH